MLSQLHVSNAQIFSIQAGDSLVHLVIAGQFATLAAAKSAARVLAASHPGLQYWVRPAQTLATATTAVVSSVPGTNDTVASADRRSSNASDISTPDARQPSPSSLSAATATAKAFSSEQTSSDPSAKTVTTTTPNTPAANGANSNGSNSQRGSALHVDEVRIELAVLPDSAARARAQQYLSGQISGRWRPANNWELQLAGRFDGYYQQGDSESQKNLLDYGESWLRYTGENWRFTLGTQKVLWGRIDEVPPGDRLSTQDLTRFVLDELADRRRAAPALRLEHYLGNATVELLLLPTFRAAELPGKSNVWYPINQRDGTVLGLRSNPLTTAIVKTATIDLDQPDDSAGFGLRYSALARNIDYAITVQRGRQTIPYFTYDPAHNRIGATYPRTWIVSGDAGFEALGGTVRVELAWLDETPVTGLRGQFDTVNSISWGASYEFFPGDGDARINLQLLGNKLLDPGPVLDRTEAYFFSGSLDTPFDDDSWRFKTRFFIGLDRHDLYVSPQISYTGWRAQELYLNLHFFDGADGTGGGFHQDNSIATLGWRRHF